MVGEDPNRGEKGSECDEEDVWKVSSIEDFSPFWDWLLREHSHEVL